MALEILTLKNVLPPFNDVKSVAITADLRLLSVLTRKHHLLVHCLTLQNCNYLSLSDIQTYAWQEDICSDSFYKVLAVGLQGDVTCYDIEVKYENSSVDAVSVFNTQKWNMQTIFVHFQGFMRGFEKGVPTEILKFETKEAVVVFDGKFVITFFLSISNDPQIISFTDISEDMNSARKILLIKETLFVLNGAGTKLSAYSVSNNSKILEVDFMKCSLKSEEIKSVHSFIVRLEMDMIVLYTENHNIYFMAIEMSNIDTMKFSLTQNACVPQTNIVTAFSKQYPSVRRLDDNSRRCSVSTTSGLLQPVLFAFDITSYKLGYLAVYNSKLCFLFYDDTTTLIGIHKLDAEAHTTFKRLPDPAFVVKGSSESFPFLILSGNTLSLLLYDVEPDKLINELMIYQCSNAAEELSHLNNWQNIKIDVEVLKQGLRNRQLDAVEFFMKTHEEGFYQQLKITEAKHWIEVLKSALLLWDQIMKLLVDTLHQNFTDNSSCHFAEQLLEVTISSLLHLLTAVKNSKCKEDVTEVTANKNLAAAQFSKYLQSVRQLVHEGMDSNSEVSDNEISVSDKKVYYTSEILKQWKEWDKKPSWQEVVSECVHKGNIAMGQSYFFNHKDPSKKKHSTYKTFQNTGLNFVSYYLKQGCLDEAVAMLSNLGISVNEKLHDIFKATSERDTRETLKNELKERSLLSAVDEKSLCFMSMLEILYPCSSFEHARQLIEEKSSVLEVYPRCAFSESKSDELIVGDFITPNLTNCETGAYCRIVLNWVLLWEDEVKERILVPHFLKGHYNFKIDISPISVWNYLLEYGELSLITKWIHSYLGLLPNHSPEEFPYKWPLNAVMVNAIGEMAPLHVAETALNELARYGVFCEEEEEEISLFLHRIGQSQCNLNAPSIFLSSTATISFQDLCHRLVHYCLKHHLVHFLSQFLKNNYDRFKTWQPCNICDVSLWRTMKKFCAWSQNHEDSLLAYNAVISTAQHVYNIPQFSIKNLLTKVPAPLNIAILLFSPKPLAELINEEITQDSNIASVKDLPCKYPLLYDNLFKCEEDRLPDVSVYQLLQGNSWFDLTQLFGWQTTNTIRSEDAQLELPHFSLNTLSEQHGLKEALTYFYYLMEGRPNFAYLKFIAQELAPGNSMSVSRLRFGCKQVFSFAMSNFRSEKICAACVSFIEMLGQDSLPLRTCLINANMLFESHSQKCEAEFSNGKIFQEISAMFTQAHENKDVAAQLISLREADILLKQNSISTTSILSDIVQWMPLIALAHLYEVDAGESYLSECAKNDEWLKYLLFAQIFQIPKEQVLKILPKFSNSCIENHLCNALQKKPSFMFDVQQTEKKQLTSKRDLRTSLYSRIGVTRGVSVSPENSGFAEVGSSFVHDESKNVAIPESDEDHSSICSGETSSSSDHDSGADVVLKDLFGQLLHSHNTDVPWVTLLHTSYVLHNPVLSLLAASYPDSELLSCFTTWLATALPRKNVQKGQDSNDVHKAVISWSETDLENLIIQTVKDRKILLLWQGISLFLFSTPLLSLMEFLVSFIVYKKFDSSVENLKLFQKKLWNYPQDEDLQSPLHSIRWIEKTSILILKEVVVTCSTSYERQLMLRHLFFARIENSFSSEVAVPAFNKLYQMVQYFGDSEDVTSVEKFLLPPSNLEYKNACWKSVKKLLKLHLYNEAKMFANVAGLPSEEVLLLQINQESDEIRKTEDWSTLISRINFWKKIMSILKENKVKPYSAAEFFKTQCEIANKYSEKYFLMQLVIKCLNGIAEDVDKSEIAALTTNMWWWCIKAEVEGEFNSEPFDTLLSTQVADLCKEMSEQDLCTIVTLDDDKETAALERIIAHLLAKGDLHQAFQVSKTFNHECNEIKIVLMCEKLAREEIEPSSINLEKSLHFEDTSKKRKKSMVSWTLTENGPTSEQMEIMSLIEKMCDKTEVATPICNRILVHYTVASILNLHYSEVSDEKDPLVILKNVLISKYNDKFGLARSLITVHELHDKDVAKFLSQEIQNSLKVIYQSAVILPENELALSTEDGLIYNPAIASESFQLIVKLCQDPSLLGKKLMEIFSAEATNIQTSINDNSLYEMVELCICAHDCFTAACNMVGISQVLHKCQMLIAGLADCNKFSLMIRLLTGVGRYSEMNYVFDILQEHEQFELLFRKGRDKVPHLRLALLDYLKRSSTTDAELYSMLALNFCMFREIAEMLEMSARQLLSQLCKRNSDLGLKGELEKVKDDLADAAKWYCKADCLLQAQLCAQLAELVALQVYLLPSGMWVIGLDDMSITRCIIEHSTFYQALIIAEAYKHHHSWSQAVYHNVVNKGDWDYLRELQAHFGLTASLIEDVVKRFQQSSNKSDSQVKNMKRVLSLCSNIEIKYELVNKLGFKDMALELMMGDGGAFLKDLDAMKYFQRKK